MRSFFKKPSWANTGDDSAAPEFYRRSTQTYDDIVAASRQQHESTTASKSKYQSDSGKSVKRRRLSESPTVEGPDPVLATLQVDTVQCADHNLDLHSKHETGHDIENCIRNEDTQKQIPSEQAVQEDEPGSAAMLPTMPGKVHPPQARTLNPTSSDEVSCSATQTDSSVTYSARKDQVTNSQKSQNNVQAQLEVSHRVQAIPVPRQNHQSAGNGTTQCSDTSQNDEIVQILITSALENTKPLVVQRLMSQRLRDVRLTWCARQGFGEKMTSSVFLTWNRKRLFDVTTCRSLCAGTNTPPSDHWAVDDQISAESVTHRLHMEAVTEELLKSQKEAEDSRDFGEQKPGTDEMVIKIILKSIGSQDIPINVRDSTKISHVISTYRDKNRMSRDKTVHLMFDGEQLNPESTIGNYEITDLDLVEVLMK